MLVRGLVDVLELRVAVRMRGALPAVCAPIAASSPGGAAGGPQWSNSPPPLLGQRRRQLRARSKRWCGPAHARRPDLAVALDVQESRPGCRVDPAGCGAVRLQGVGCGPWAPRRGGRGSLPADRSSPPPAPGCRVVVPCFMTTGFIPAPVSCEVAVSLCFSVLWGVSPLAASRNCQPNRSANPRRRLTRSRSFGAGNLAAGRRCCPRHARWCVRATARRRQVLDGLRARDDDQARQRRNPERLFAGVRAAVDDPQLVGFDRAVKQHRRVGCGHDGDMRLDALARATQKVTWGGRRGRRLGHWACPWMEGDQAAFAF